MDIDFAVVVVAFGTGVLEAGTVAPKEGGFVVGLMVDGFRMPEHLVLDTGTHTMFR